MQYKFVLLILFSINQTVFGDCNCPKGFNNEPALGMCIGSPELYGHGWDANERSCETFGGTLVTIHSGFTNSILSAITSNLFGQSRAMIGLRRVINVSDWEWTDQSPYNYNNWASGHPLDDTDCASLDGTDHKWYSEQCSQQNSYLCQLTSLNKCLKDYVYNNNTSMCYLISNTSAIWVDAEAHCLRDGGHLASIHSDDENAFLQDLTYRDSCAGEFPIVAGTFLTGGTSSNGKTIDYWTDGTAADYNDFCDHNAALEKSSVLMRSMPENCDFGCGDGRWMAGIADIMSATRSYPGFICKTEPLC